MPINLQDISYKKETLPDSQVKLSLELPWEVWSPFIAKASVEYSKQNPISGFRPGNVPESKIRELVGEEYLTKMGSELATKEALFLVNKKENFFILEIPKLEIEKSEKEKTLQALVIITIYPNVVLCPLEEIKFKKPNLQNILIKKEVVDATIKEIIESRAKLITVNEKAQNGYLAIVDYKIFLAGAPLENGSSINFPIILGDKRNNLIPGFEKEVLGMKKDDRKRFILSFPKDYPDKKLKGKQTEIELIVKLIQKRELPELNDTFISSVSSFKTVKEFRENLKKTLKKNEKEKIIDNSIKEFIQKIIKKSTISLPKILIDKKSQDLLNDIKNKIQDLDPTGTFDNYLEHLKKTEAELLESLKDKAKESLCESLVLERIAQKEKIKIKNGKLNPVVEWIKEKFIQ